MGSCPRSFTTSNGEVFFQLLEEVDPGTASDDGEESDSEFDPSPATYSPPPAPKKEQRTRRRSNNQTSRTQRRLNFGSSH